MSKLKEIKAELAKMLLKFETVKTDKAVLEYDGELAENTKVYVVVEDERVAAGDGDYVLEDGRTLVVADGVIKEIKEKVEEPEVTEPETEPDEVVTEDTVTEPEATEEEVAVVIEEVVDPDNTDAENLENAVAELVEAKVEIEKLKARIKELEDELADKEKKFSTMSMAKPIAEEFETQTTIKRTGDSKVDKFLERFGNK